MRNNNFIISSALFLGLFLPQNSMGYVVQGILPLILFWNFANKGSFKINKTLFGLIIIIIISFVVNVFFFDSYISIQSIFRLFSFLLLFALFPFVSNGFISQKTIYIAFGIIFISQIVYLFNFPYLISFFDAIYPYKGEKAVFMTENLVKNASGLEALNNKRFGGLFHNPNQCARYISLLLLIYLIGIKNEGKKMNLFFILLVFVGVIFTGSRAGFVVAFLILLYFLFFHKKEWFVAKNIFRLIFLSLVFFLIYSILTQFNLRAFEISSGAGGSLYSKFLFFKNFFIQLDSPFRVLFGHFSPDNILKLYNEERMDSEWGELFYNFGLLGTSFLLIFYFKLWKTKDPDIRYYMIFLLWGVTNTLLFSYRMSFIFMLLLSLYYANYKRKIKDRNHYQKAA